MVSAVTFKPSALARRMSSTPGPTAHVGHVQMGPGQARKLDVTRDRS